VPWQLALDISLLGPYGNRRAALISLRSGAHLPRTATDRVDSGRLAVWPATYDTDTDTASSACTHETMSTARIMGLEKLMRLADIVPGGGGGG